MPVDLYCERVGPGLWGEPLNSLSNLAFLVATVAVLWQARQSPWPVRTLGVLLGLIFAGSTVFHLVATGWGAALDTGAIAVYLLYYVAAFAHWFHGVRWRYSWLGVPVFVALTAVTALLGGGMYGSALVALVVLAAWLRRRAHSPRWREFALAAVLFAVSLTLRTLDGPLCPVLPIGTHYGWHILNAVVLYVASLAAIRQSAGRVTGGMAPSTAR